ncbi:hypothetical protein SODALDRAFT_328470 [Sodiomyces alkalinus F11]|uniref:TRIP4/RQT4 C2HC5-type zinc finger domain-containing protein n=1 Tax=Sodiomyces alkalinus (strain CBS 110278 / VKM F-3762 / F11) TaxID=1314773 RepID=A0A3N2PP16_SODAK|nr:hypothetical protein SODALDRAFT_328470 [Sodiomyces alkalinus F11]ROT36096.1 hypothetical protein SODALDRAFT_328470 [Sodiomyces alkalinus F11]
MSLSQLAHLLPLPEEELQQVVDYASTLSKEEAAAHFGNLLGDSPAAIEFISSFNARRHNPKPDPTPASGSAATSTRQVEVPPKSRRGQSRKKKGALHTPAARQVGSQAPPPGTAYSKKGLEEDYIPKRPSSAVETTAQAAPRVQQGPPTSATPPPQPQPQPQQQQQQQRTAAGYLISEGPTKTKSKSTPVTRSTTPKSRNENTKVTITGGLPMAGASTALKDLDAAIRTLEMTTNPTLQGDVKTRRCNCVATRHGLQSAAPNCLSCGKVICLKEGLGPCTYCGAPLLSSDDVQAMVRELRAEMGREKMAADRDARRRPEISKKPAPFGQHRATGAAAGNSSSHAEAEAQARAHRDKLLGFQAQNAQRTTVRDEAADFDVSGAMAGTGGSIWSTPEERARELKRQQKVLREMEWNARPEYEKRRQIVSIDLVGGRVVKQMAAVERPPTPEDDGVMNEGVDADEDEGGVRIGGVTADDLSLRGPSGGGGGGGGGGGVGGAFSHNPLLGHLIKPVYEPKGKRTELEGRKDRKTKWRRVQDDTNDNEGVILDGGVHGFSTTADEPACG